MPLRPTPPSPPPYPHRAGTGGENICFDPLGTHTRAFITDMRPKLFDGNWKGNIGGGDFLQVFGPDGRLQYLKGLDPQLHVSGPCLSKADYSAVTLDGAISSHVTLSGSRTDDLVRVFIDVRLTALHATAFKRILFFQLASETYSYEGTFERFAWGGAGAATQYTPRDCTVSGGGDRAASKLYEESTRPFRASAEGSAPWWFAFEDTVSTPPADKPHMKVGDRGFVVRNYSAVLGGVEVSQPHYSVLCDKIELGTPPGLQQLAEGDYVHLQLELLVLPRSGADYDEALGHTGSRTLRDQLNGLSTSERVRAQAVGGEIRVTAIRDARVDGEYPVRIFATAGGNAMFEVQSQAATELVADMTGWCVGNLKEGDFCCAASCGQCDADSSCGARGIGGSCCTTTLSAPCLTDSQHTCINPASFGADVHIAPLGYVPITIAGLASHEVPHNHGLWLRPKGESNFTLLTQGSGIDFWQSNYDRASGSYEIVYNVELIHASTTVAFGSDPLTWPVSTTPETEAPPGLHMEGISSKVIFGGTHDHPDTAPCTLQLRSTTSGQSVLVSSCEFDGLVATELPLSDLIPVSDAEPSSAVHLEGSNAQIAFGPDGGCALALIDGKLQSRGCAFVVQD